MSGPWVTGEPLLRAYTGDVPDVRAEAEASAARVFAAAVASGDENGVAAVVRHHLPRLARYLRRLGADPGLSEDIAQESLLRAVLACRAGRPPTTLGPWLYAVATNLWRDVARSAERRHTTVGLPAAPVAPDASAAIAEAEDLRAALGRLPRELRAVVVLRFFEGLTLREVARVTGAPLGTVKVAKWRMFTALRRLRAAS